MLTEIKKNLLEQPDKIIELLEHYGYAHIKLHHNYISCARDESSSPKSIVVWLEDNDYLNVNDFPRNLRQDIISYIMEQQRVEFKDVVGTIKQILGIDDYYSYFEKKPKIFGGFFDKIRKKNEPVPVRTIDENLVDNYERVCNLRFLKDNISLEAQMYFDIRYDVNSEGIVIPIYTQLGQLMGIKVRCNYDELNNPMKYWYIEPCQMSHTLYGFSQNYNYLQSGTILVFESEKSVMQCYSYGIRNCVALGSGSISLRQCKMLLEIAPKRVIFLHDTGYDRDSIFRNMTLLKNYSRFSEVKVGYWNFFGRDYKDKCSPSDFGGDELKRILQTEIVFDKGIN